MIILKIIKNIKLMKSKNNLNKKRLRWRDKKQCRKEMKNDGKPEYRAALVAEEEMARCVRDEGYLRSTWD